MHRQTPSFHRSRAVPPPVPPEASPAQRRTHRRQRTAAMIPTPPSRFGIRKSALVVEGRRLHRETGSAWDATIAPSEHFLRAGAHEKLSEPVDPGAFTITATMSRPATAAGVRPDPKLFLTRGGVGHIIKAWKVRRETRRRR